MLLLFYISSYFFILSEQVSSRRLLSSSAIETPGYSSQRQEYRSQVQYFIFCIIHQTPVTNNSCSMQCNQMHELRKRWKEEITEKNEKLLEFKA